MGEYCIRRESSRNTGTWVNFCESASDNNVWEQDVVSETHWRYDSRNSTPGQIVFVGGDCWFCSRCAYRFIKEALLQLDTAV